MQRVGAGLGALLLFIRKESSGSIENFVTNIVDRSL